MTVTPYLILLCICGYVASAHRLLHVPKTVCNERKSCFSENILMQSHILRIFFSHNFFRYYSKGLLCLLPDIYPLHQREHRHEQLSSVIAWLQSAQIAAPSTLDEHQVFMITLNLDLVCCYLIFFMLEHLINVHYYVACFCTKGHSVSCPT